MARRLRFIPEGGALVEVTYRTFSKLPCWAHLDDSTYKRRISEVIARIEKAGKKNRVSSRGASMNLSPEIA